MKITTGPLEGHHSAFDAGQEIQAQNHTKMKQAAKISADQSIKQAQESIESEKRAAIQELKTQVAGIAIQMAEKVLHSELDDKDKTDYMHITSNETIEGTETFKIKLTKDDIQKPPLHILWKET